MSDQLLWNLLKLHYSQTCLAELHPVDEALEPFEITLLSNLPNGGVRSGQALEPFEITLLSNFCPELILTDCALEPFEITLLSNLKSLIHVNTQTRGYEPLGLDFV